MGRLKDYLTEGKILILDGALGTEIENRGYNISNKLWSATYLVKNNNIISQIHLDYLKAGADIITTSSYQATLKGLIQELNFSESKAKDLIALTVKLAKIARDDFWESLDEKHKEKRLYPLIGGDIGPYAAYLADGSEYTGIYPENNIDFKAFHRERIAILIENGVDFLIIETIPNQKETIEIIELLEEEFPTIDAYLSLTLKEPNTITDGTLFTDLIEKVNHSSQIVAVGANCCSPKFISPTLKKLKPLTSKPFVIYPNSGETYNGSTKTWSSSSNNYENFFEEVSNWVHLGTQIVGGCCRTRPSDIKKIRTNLYL